MLPLNAGERDREVREDERAAQPAVDEAAAADVASQQGIRRDSTQRAPQSAGRGKQ